MDDHHRAPRDSSSAWRLLVICIIIAVVVIAIAAVVINQLDTGYCSGAAPIYIDLHGPVYQTGVGGNHWVNFTSFTGNVSTSEFGFKIADKNGNSVAYASASLLRSSGGVIAIFIPGNGSWNVSVNPDSTSQWFSFNSGSQNVQGSGDSISVYPLHPGGNCPSSIGGGYSDL
jgi:hypothetical protein